MKLNVFDLFDHRKPVDSHTSRFAYKAIRIHRGRFADTTLVDSHTSKLIRLH